MARINMSKTITPPKSEFNWQADLTAPIPVNDSPGVSEFIQETLALTKRLFIQLQRRPSTLMAGIIQPLMWLILFGALFQNAPQGIFGESLSYGKFLGAGVIVFTAFAGALKDLYIRSFSLLESQIEKIAKIAKIKICNFIFSKNITEFYLIESLVTKLLTPTHN